MMRTPFTIVFVATAALVLAFHAVPAAAACEHCYECPVLSTMNAGCCLVGGSLCDWFANQDECYRAVSYVTDCMEYPVDNGYACTGSQTCGGGGGGGTGGGGGGGGQDCSYGPGDPFCPASCSHCSWDPYLY